MSNPQIDYANLVEKALLRVVQDVLAMVAKDGLPGRHHIYITFRTDHPDVVMDDQLLARYPSEMTIVLQHEFWDLEVTDERFKITLNFNSVPHRLEIPFAAVTVFADPSVEFGLQFNRAGAPEAEPATPAPVAKLPVATEKGAEPPPAKEEKDEAKPEPATAEKGESTEGTQEEGGEDKIVTLDRFRKK